MGKIVEFFSISFMLKFLRFGVVGFSGMIVDFGVTWLLKEKMRIKPLVSNAIGFILAAFSNYVFNRWWTFKSTNADVAREFSSFFIISLIGLLLNTFIVWIFIRKFRMNFYMAKVIAIAIVTLWNFFANLFITFG